MSGTERVRFCGLCQKSVYELSGLTRAEVLALLQAKPDACVTFFQREDGTVLTADCPVGERLTRTARRIAWATRSVLVAMAGAAATTLLGLCGAGLVSDERESLDDMIARCTSQPPLRPSHPPHWRGSPFDPNMRGGGARVVTLPPEHRSLRDPPRPAGPVPHDVRDLQTRE